MTWLPFSNQDSWDKQGNLSLKMFFQAKRTLAFREYGAPELSIIIVCYNKAHLSVLCLQHLLMAVDVPYELIVVDNNSTDATRALLNRCSGCKVISNSENKGFGEACIQASQIATGEFLLFLNNDSVLRPGSIRAALRNFEDSAVGAVGGKILLADGCLQEAGSIVWRDGSALGYGRLDDPTLATYEFRRPVDYCSGAFLFTRRALFKALGGFQECYSPAYYEDTDYCMSLWSQGYKVIYEPEAVVQHYESASSGGNQAAIARIASNQKIFASRWNEALYGHLIPAQANIIRARLANSAPGLRIVYVDDRVPRRLLGAGYPRSNDILRAIVRLGHHVTCVSANFPVTSIEQEYLDVPREVELLDQFRYRSSLFTEYIPQADIVWISRPPNLANFLDALLEFSCDMTAKLIFDAEAIFSEREQLQLQLTNRKISPLIPESRIRRELDLSQAADAVVVVSEGDGKKFRRAGVSNVHVIGTCLQAIPTIAPFRARDTFLFVGAIHGSNSPNADSMRYFCREIWPQVRRQTGAELVIAGFGTDKHLDVEANGARRVGTVEDLREVFEHAKVFVIPTRYAGGIPLKALEAAASGVPMVVSSLIANQLGWTPGKEILVGNGAGEFADRCCELYRDENLWNEVRVNALIRIVKEFGPDAFFERVKSVFNSVRADLSTIKSVNDRWRENSTYKVGLATDTGTL